MMCTALARRMAISRTIQAVGGARWRGARSRRTIATAARGRRGAERPVPDRQRHAGTHAEHHAARHGDGQDLAALHERPQECSTERSAGLTILMTVLAQGRRTTL